MVLKNNGQPPVSCFTCTRLNPTTFKIVEDDQWLEQPLIYVKITEEAIVLIDTGCGGAARDPNVSQRSLREFLESIAVEDNGNEPLNKNGVKDYVVICTHCHYDHIGGIEQFTDSKSSIWASDYDKSFITDPDQFPTNSLCRFVGMKTPVYKITNWAYHGQAINYKGQNLGLQILQTPGHTQDELAVWDPTERTLYVGDTLYEWTNIVIPVYGSDLKLYSKSLGLLKGYVRLWNSDFTLPKVKIACGHVTYAADGAEILDEVDFFLYQVVSGQVDVSKEREAEGVTIEYYERSDHKFAISGPKLAFEEFRLDEEAMELIKLRQNR